MSDATAAKQRWSFLSHLPRGAGWWSRLCYRGIVLFLVLHALYLLPAFPIPDVIRWPAGVLLFIESVFFLGEMGSIAMGTMLILGALLVSIRLLGIFMPRARGWLGEAVELGVEEESGEPRSKWAFRPWVLGFVWTALFFGHLTFDLDAYLGIVCFVGVALLLPETWALLHRAWPPLRERYARFIWIAFGLVSLIFSPDFAIAVGVVLWLGILLFVNRRLVPRFVLRDRFAFTMLCIPVPQLVAAVLPLGIDLHGGRPIGDSMAYSFCEVDGRIFGAIPRCSPQDLEPCLAGTIDEFEAASMKPTAQYRFLTLDFAGRLEQLICMDDKVQVGMDITFVEGERFAQSTLTFDLDDPSRFTTNDTGDEAGDGLVWDPKRNAGFYSSANHELIRLDFETGEVDLDVAKVGDVNAVAAVKYHPERDRIYVARFYNSVVEVDPVSYEVTASYPILNAWELEIDPEMDRLYAVGNWGLEVVDLKTGKVIHRARVGLVGRRPAIDRKHDIIYVPATAGGRIHAFDRKTLKRLGAIPLGSGIRLPFVSDRYGHVLATNGLLPYRWDAAALANWMRGGSSP